MAPATRCWMPVWMTSGVAQVAHVKAIYNTNRGTIDHRLTWTDITLYGVDANLPDLAMMTMNFSEAISFLMRCSPVQREWASGRR